MAEFKDPILFSANDTQQVHHTLMSQARTIEQQAADIEAKENMLTSLEQTMKETLEAKDSDLSNLTTKMVDEALSKERHQNKKITDKLMTDLENRIQKVLKLEMELDFHQDEYAKLEAMYLEKDKPAKQEQRLLRDQLADLSQMYHAKVSESKTNELKA